MATKSTLLAGVLICFLLLLASDSISLTKSQTVPSCHSHPYVLASDSTGFCPSLNFNPVSRRLLIELCLLTKSKIFSLFLAGDPNDILAKTGVVESIESYTKVTCESATFIQDCFLYSKTRREGIEFWMLFEGEEVQRCDREGDREEIGWWRRLTLGGKRERERVRGRRIREWGSGGLRRDLVGVEIGE
ncbi:S-alkyl-thiohydroximate lyase SUR1-like isoform X2 [Senna tora]|uniref:S-alkyl-thiohydroximate lyase SUR1-like isoform X2 n=1 Tax=Senna tora TaxID=362788 RepID=A0A834TND2_9FABA|nr:S-alkyl-thiohydroximate lyase SUR1-like isoform X2 [Senna tora]